MIKNENVNETGTCNFYQKSNRYDQTPDEVGRAIQELDQFKILADRLLRLSLDSDASGHWQHDVELAATTITRLIATVKTLKRVALYIKLGIEEVDETQHELLAHLLLTREAFLNWFNSKRIDVESEIPFVFSRDSEFPELRESGAHPTPLRPESEDSENASGQNGQPANNENASQTSER